MIRLDMSEYKEAYTVSRLLGSPPGYIGYEDEGTFATRLRRQPYAVVLMDEFEKAHPQVLDVFLHIFDEGRFSDARGRQIDARQAVFILTSNLFTVSQSNSHEEYEEHCESIRRSLNGTLRTEFINRINEIVLFEELDIPDLVEIARMEIASLAGRLAGQGCQLEVDEEVYHWIAAEAFDPASGARAVLRLITRQIVQPLGEILLQGSKPRTVRVAIEGDEIRLT
jgi:ATP-dependent Clp protease ATP-binding subunit ClpB